MTKRVLILTCDSGGGHRSVADAIVGALEHLFPGKYHISLADIMAECFPFPMNQAGRMYGPVVNRLPRSWGLLWHVTNGLRRSPWILRLAYPFAVRRLESILRAAIPDVVVSTHPWANHIPAWLLRGLNWDSSLVTVVTDLVSIHHWWLCPEVDACLVPTYEARRKALDAGVAPDKVKVVGMPVDLEFVDGLQDKSELREQLGLQQNGITVLVAGGGDGMGNVFPVARAAAQVGLEVQLVVVAGRNDRLKNSLEAVSWEVPTSILGFVDNMPDLMRAADLLVTKAGPSTISEALCCGLPMLISGALRGQEEGNAEWVASTGAALLTPTPQALTAALSDLVRDGKESLVRMRHRAREAAQPEAALNAARHIHNLVRHHHQTDRQVANPEG